MSKPSSNPFGYLTRARLWACGRPGEGGSVVIQDGALYAKIALPAASFDVLIIFIQAAKRAKASEPWVPVEFLSVKELRRELTKQAGGSMRLQRVGPDYVIRAIHRLRKAIGEALFPKGGGGSYIMQLLEKTNLGYRLSTDASNLHLGILGEQEPGPDLVDQANTGTAADKEPEEDDVGMDRESGLR